MKKLLLLFLFLLSISAIAQEDPAKKDNNDSKVLNLSSPYYSLYTFLCFDLVPYLFYFVMSSVSVISRFSPI